MSNWKQLTSTTGALIDVNLDAVACLYPSKELITVYFTVAGDHVKLFGISVKGAARRHSRRRVTRRVVEHRW
jgi:hypothetical protein